MEAFRGVLPDAEEEEGDDKGEGPPAGLEAGT